MTKLSKRAALILAVAALTACSSSSKISKATTTTTPSSPTTTSTTGPTLGPNDIRIESIGTPVNKSQTIVITGAFADAGTFAFSGRTSTVTLSKGSIQADASAGGKAENALFADMTKILNPKTCGIYGSYTAPVTLLSGTGSYAGIHGKLTVTTTEFGALPVLPNGTCNQNASPIGFLSVAEGVGTISFR